MTIDDPTGRARVADDPHSLSRLEQLLLRYPALDQAENREVGRLLLATGPLDMGLLSANRVAWAKAELYRAEHPDVFRMSLTIRVGLVALAVLTVAIIWWLSDIAVP